MDEFDTYNKDTIICPLCGYYYLDSWEFKEGGELECESCNGEFHFERNHFITYTTKKYNNMGD